MVIGLVLSFSGGSWDITFHILSQPESFFSYPHSLVYSGILLVIFIFLINLRKNFSEEKIIKRNNLIILAGIVLILTAGPFDFSWHLKFGLDGLLSPPHLTLLTGWLLIAIGNLRITNIRLNRAKLKNETGQRQYGPFFPFSKLTKTRSMLNNKVVNDKMSFRIQDDKGSRMDKVNIEGGTLLYQTQLFLNLSILLMIISGFLYFFSLPFSETQSYNFNPPPFLALLVYGLGFPILFSGYFVKIFTNYHDLKIMVPLVGTFYVIITLVTQISSNSFLSGYAGYYLLNLIPFLLFYLVNRYYSAKTNYLRNSNNFQSIHPKEKNIISIQNSKYLIMAITFGLLSYSLCFPLNSYIYNEEIYGYLIYQNLVIGVYQMVFSENFVIILPMSIVGGCLGFLLARVKHIHPKPKG